MTKLRILINVKPYTNYSTYSVNKGFIKIPNKFAPYWLNKRQCIIQNNVAKDFIDFLKENKAEIYYRYSRKDDWTKYEYEGGTNDEN